LAKHVSESKKSGTGFFKVLDFSGIKFNIFSKE